MILVLKEIPLIKKNFTENQSGQLIHNFELAAFSVLILNVKLAFCDYSVKPESNSMKVEYFDVLVAT